MFQRKWTIQFILAFEFVETKNVSFFVFHKEIQENQTNGYLNLNAIFKANIINNTKKCPANVSKKKIQWYLFYRLIGNLIPLDLLWPQNATTTCFTT